ncbi:MAG: hypothetical protein M0P97_01295 [Candidatus Moranbacteria bacterium]|nr:hypothetical protein [Candidatus Moranbacteria bacterium]
MLGCFKGLLYKKIEPATKETVVDIYKLSKGVQRTVEEIYQSLSLDKSALYLTQAQIRQFLLDIDWRPIQRQNILFLMKWGIGGMILRMECGPYGIPYFEMSGMEECGRNWQAERDDEINQQYYFVVPATRRS